ncbi:MAG: ABC transporter ATP-binding protein [Deltaproteobacteria bacterium]|nr:ABC transporter ATP-binding protein [Deltaproteobacteria bacterium]
MRTDAPIVRLRDVRFRYAAAGQPVDALAGIDLELERGAFVSIMGPSGSGKSTLLHLIAGIDEPTSGEVLVEGRSLRALSDDERSAFRLRHVGIVFQAFNLLPSLTVAENVLWPLEFLGVPAREARSRATAALDDVLIPASAHQRRPAEISGGEQQRVAMARAIATSPQLLLADEPTGNLDTRTGEAILALLQQLHVAKGLTIVQVTHSEAVAAYSERIIELRDGRVVEHERCSSAAEGGQR